MTIRDPNIYSEITFPTTHGDAAISMINLVQKFLGFLKSPRERSQFATLAQNLQAGGLYSIIHDSDAGTFGVVKILVLEPSEVHLCIYANTFSSRLKVLTSLHFHWVELTLKI